MTLDIQKHRTHASRDWTSRVLWCVVVACLFAIAWLVYDGRTTHLPSTQTDAAYTVNQSLVPTVSYFDTNLFKESRGTQTAYIRELTKDISTNAVIRFQAKSVTDLKYHYAVTARVIASYASQGKISTNDTEPAVVWERLYHIDHADGVANSDTVSLSKKATIPYDTYAKEVAELNAVLGLNLNAKLEIRTTTTFTGTVAGRSFSEPRSMTLTMPLSDPVFTITSDYKKHDSGQIEMNSVPAAKAAPWWQQHRLMMIVILAVMALVGAVVALWLPRREGGYTLRNPYQRAVAKIYRYHDGVIIRTNRPIELREREIISVKTFDDLLNVSDELRSPVIANELSDTATQFVVLHETTVYVYLVGRLVKREESLPLPKKAPTRIKKK